MIRRIVLRILDLLAPFLSRTTMDYPTLRAILDVKLTLDNRRAGSALYRNVDRTASNAMLLTMFMYVLSGGVCALILSQSANLLTGMTLLFGFMMVLLGMSLIADLSTVLLDTSDFQILLPLPIDSGTLSSSRTLHVAIYLGLLVMSLMIFPLFAGTARMGILFAPLFLIAVAGVAVLLLSATQAIYAFGLETMKGERFRDVVVYLQAFMVAFLMLTYFVTIHLNDENIAIAFDLKTKWWIYLLPPVWFAAPFDAFATSWSALHVTLSMLAVCVTLASLLLLVRVFGPRYQREVTELAISGSGVRSRSRQAAAPPSLQNRSHAPARVWSGRPFTRTAAEEGAFGFTWIMIRRDREFRMRTLPILALIPVYILFFVFGSNSNAGGTLAALRESDRYFYILYIIAYLAPTSLLSLRYSSNWQAAWIYEALPFHRAGEVLSGAVKAVMARLYLPILVLGGVGVVSIWGIGVIDDVLLSGSATLVAILLFAITAGRRYPFSEEFVVARGAGRSGVLMILFFLPLTFGVLHSYVSRRAPFLVWVLLVLSAPAVWGLFRRLARIDARQMKGSPSFGADRTASQQHATTKN